MSVPLAFLIISSLILWFIIGARGKWFIKLITITLTLYLCISLSLSLENWSGWPSSQTLPDEFMVHWIQISEPNKQTGKPGNIYVWVTSLEKYYQDDGWDDWREFFISFYTHDLYQPRAYKLPYSLELHKKAQGALGNLIKGEKIKGGVNGRRGDNGENTKGDGGSFSYSEDIIFHKLPPSKLPDK